MRVVNGRALMVAVDIRPGSPTLGRHVTVEGVGRRSRSCSGRRPRSRAGSARSSDVDGDRVLLHGGYNPAAESGIRWDDPDIGHRVAGRGPAAVGQGRRRGVARRLARAARIRRLPGSRRAAERRGGPGLPTGTFGWCPGRTVALARIGHVHAAPPIHASIRAVVRAPVGPGPAARARVRRRAS